MIKLLVALLLLGCFNVVFFCLSDVALLHTAAWISYGFVSFALLFPFFLSVVKYKKSDIHATMVIVGSIYTIVEFIVGGLFMVFNPDAYKWALILQVLLLCLALMAFLAYLKLDRYN